MHAEVAKARSARGAHQRNALHQPGHREHAVRGEGAFFLQGGEGGLLASFRLAHHGVEVDVFNHQAHPKHSMVVDSSAEHNLGTGLQDVVGVVSEFGLDDVGLTAPQGAAHHGQPASVLLFHQVEVDMACGACGQLADFSLEPQGPPFSDTFQRALQALPQLGEGVDGFFSGLRHVGFGVQCAPKVQDARRPPFDTNDATCMPWASHSRRWSFTTLSLFSTRPARSATTN